MINLIYGSKLLATREPIPAFLIGLTPESLLDLSWTDPQLGVQDCAWWPEENGDGELAACMKGAPRR